MFSSKSHPIVWQVKMYFMILVGILDIQFELLDVPHCHINNIIFKRCWLKHYHFPWSGILQAYDQKQFLENFVVFYQKMGIFRYLSFSSVNLTKVANFF
jgi:hypothetical protein